MGDAAGIGPEIIAKAFALGELADAVVVGDARVMRRAGAAMTAVIDSPDDLSLVPPGCLPVLQPPGLPADLAGLPPGLLHARHGAAAARCIEHAVALVLGGAGVDCDGRARGRCCSVFMGAVRRATIPYQHAGRADDPDGHAEYFGVVP